MRKTSHASVKRTRLTPLRPSDQNTFHLANGSATALPYNTIRLFITAPDDISPLGDYDDWYLELITHEHTHILHTDNITGVPAVVNRLMGKWWAPNQAQPVCTEASHCPPVAARPGG